MRKLLFLPIGWALLTQGQLLKPRTTEQPITETTKIENQEPNGYQLRGQIYNNTAKPIKNDNQRPYFGRY
jgi:hypothetical protein